MSRLHDLRKVPSVSEMLDLSLQESWAGEYSREQLVSAVREELSDLRKLLRDGGEPTVKLEGLTRNIHSRLKSSHQFSLQRVINATGIIVHTNLGRAPLAEDAVLHISEIAGGYTNLEFDLAEGQRGSREKHVENFLTRILPAEAALVVNNNASALLLILNTLAEGKEVIVSRGELVEIGGSFRLPEIMKKSGAILCEVGTTNKTRLSDYRKAIQDNTGMILSVHPSNYRIIGFTERPSLSELALLGRERQIPVVEDEGSGIFLDLESFGISGEPRIQHSLEDGVDLICFSGDKILGGPQAGIVCGKKDLIEKLRSNALFRALRVDKMVYAALEATLLQYLKSDGSRIPVISMLSTSAEQLESRGRIWLADLQNRFPNAEWRLESTTCFVGGGVAPMKGLPSFAISLLHPNLSAEVLSNRFRHSNPPIIPRIEEGRVLLELRTISEAEQEKISTAMKTILT